MISKADARAIIFHLDPARLARLVWREAVRSLAGEAGSRELDGDRGAPFRMAAAVLDLDDGMLQVRSFYAERGVGLPENLIVLAYVDRVLVEDTERYYGEGCELPPSPEVVAEEVARAVEDDGGGVSWRAIETQLRLAYATAVSEAGESHGSVRY